MFYMIFALFIVLDEKSLILLYFLLTAILGRHRQSSVRKADLRVDAPRSLLLVILCTALSAWPTLLLRYFSQLLLRLPDVLENFVK